MTIVLLGVQAIPECAAQSAEPYVPQPQSVGIRSQVDGGAAIVTVSVQLPNPCHYCGDWGQPRRDGGNVSVDAQFWEEHFICPGIVITESTSYNLGPLAPGDYTFHFQVWGTAVKTHSFSVPVVLSVLAPLADSEVQLWWNTASNAWYRLESCSTLAPDRWTPLTVWLPGDGKPLSTKDRVLVGQAERFYRIAVAKTPPPP